MMASLAISRASGKLRAHDPRLKRDVAIKVLPDFAQDTERLRCFEHEARAASALNHPNIVTVHDMGDTNGVRWMVTELVDGRSLREVLAKGALPPHKPWRSRRRSPTAWPLRTAPASFIAT